MDELLGEFLTETNENISVLDVELVRLERDPNDKALLSNIFRLVHTIKGTCGFLGLPRLEAVAHAAENVLGRFREGTLTVTPPAVTLILESLDRIKLILAGLEATESEPAGDDSDLIRRLDAAAEGALEAPPAPPPPAAPPPAAARVEPPAAAPLPAAAQPAPPPPVAPAVAAPAAATPAAVAPAMAPSAPAAPRAEAGEEETPEETAAASQQIPGESAIAGQSIRVNVELLETLMTTVSELVLTRNQLLQILRGERESAFAAPLQRLNHVVSELQEGVMKTRMQPIGNAWAKLPRIVRDLSRELGKKIELEMHGAETELDRQVLDLIKDPLTHMVRNSADHGIETPEERTAAGKDETGTITLAAAHEGGHIIIRIADDGRGLPIGKIREKILRLGLATEAELGAMSDQQVAQYIFKPGFSTASQVTSVSGRGVGMDVVRTNIERIGGTIELSSVPGRGSTFLIKIPLTLAIVAALIVECAGERFAIPQLSVIELVRARQSGETRIERVRGTPVLRLRNRLLPLVTLSELLQIGAAGPAGAEARQDQFIVVTQVGAYSFGIVVDRVFDTEEIVVKPVARLLRQIEMFSGNTILGDGSVVMILDPNGIATATGEVVVAEDREPQARAARAARQAEKQPLLLFRAGQGAPKAVPLALIARLEHFDMRQIEVSDGQPVVQYRGELMPLIAFDFGGIPGGEGVQPALVFSDNGRSMGLMVDGILDIVEEVLHVQLTRDRPGVLGTAVIAGRSTDVIDIGHYLVQAYPDWFMSSGPAIASETERPRRILLVDDSPFFRHLLAPVLGVAGYDVETAVDAQDALRLLEHALPFDLIVSDIEMPGMSGFEFAATLRRDRRFAQMPLVALSSHATPQDLERGREAGFTDYVAKFDRDALLQALTGALAWAEHQAAA